MSSVVKIFVLYALFMLCGVVSASNYAANPKAGSWIIALSGGVLFLAFAVVEDIMFRMSLNRLNIDVKINGQKIKEEENKTK